VSGALLVGGLAGAVFGWLATRAARAGVPPPEN